MWRFALVCLVACSGPEKPPVPKPPESQQQVRAIVRIDAEPSGKMFQGVRLDFGEDQERWVIAYRARGLWKPFENQEVVVTGHCYEPDGQAISGQHFHVDTMRFVDPVQGRGALLEIGPEQRLRGRFVAHAFPAGSKLAGSSRLRFVDDAGNAYWIAGSDDELPAAGTAALVYARPVVPDLSFVAQPGGPNLWIDDIRDPDHRPDGEAEPPAPCR